jgi:hypothetical protein
LAMSRQRQALKLEITTWLLVSTFFADGHSGSCRVPPALGLAL